MKNIPAIAIAAMLFSAFFSKENLHAQTPYSVVISEIMADPTPVVGLPNAEWVELTNTTNSTIQLQGWRLQKWGANAGGAFPAYDLEAGKSVVICSAAAFDELSAFGPSLRVTSFPSLVNGGDHILLLNPTGETVHSVNYLPDWYGNTVKAQGGWTLEMIDPANPCSGASNWTASIDASGGTPGRTNSVLAPNPDRIPPVALSAAMLDQEIRIRFNEPLQLAGAGNLSNYQATPAITINAVTVMQPFRDQVVLSVTGIQANTVYTISISGLADCAGNEIAAGTNLRSGMMTEANPGDVVINEVLFDPPAEGADYVELYNRSNRIFNLRQLLISNRSSSTANPGTANALSAEDRPFFPGEYLLLSPDTAWVMRRWPASDRNRFLQMTNFPTYPNARGWVILFNGQGEIVDELPYEDKWHFSLLRNPDGVALERINPAGETGDPQNWTSAASTVNFGTPGAPNSQQRLTAPAVAGVSIAPQIFSPDNDGFDDFALVSLKMNEPGYVANITIFDAAGRPVRVLRRNASLGSTSTFRWDGLDDKQQKLPIGIYIVHTEVFNLSGKKQAFKNTVSLARKF